MTEEKGRASMRLVRMVARREVRPAPGPDDDLVEVIWRVELDEPPARAKALLDVPNSCLCFEFDHAQPSRLLGGVIPFGRMALSEDDDAIDPPRPGGLDAEICVALLGDDLFDRLDGADEVRFDVVDRPSWAAIGRVALAQTVLRKGFRPMDGLWALETGTVLADASLGPECDEWSRRLVSAAESALGLFDDRHLSDPRVLERLQHMAITARRMVPDIDLGPLLGRLADIDAASLAEQFELPSENEIDSGLRSIVTRGSYMGDAARRQAVFVDDAAIRMGVIGGEWWLEGGVLHVEIDDRIGSIPVEVHQRLSVRVTDGSGRLVASAVSMAPSGQRLSASLLVPHGLDDLVVAVGRDLPFGPCTARAMRFASQVEIARSEADRSRSDGPQAFVAEALGRSFRDGPVVGNEEGGRRPDGARALAQDLGRHGEAAGWELRRLQEQGRDEELTVEEVEWLVVASALAGDSNTARALCRLVLEFVDRDD
jgi:hypothetical protein